MATERSSIESHIEHPDQKKYDLLYYKALLPHVSGVVIDIGCGTGIFTNMIAKKNEVSKIYAVDRFPINERICESQKIVYLDKDITKGFKIEEKVDCVVSTEFIEHIKESDFLDLIVFIKSILRPGGIFIGSTPDKEVPTTNPFHLREYTRFEMEDLLKKHFKNVEVKNIGLSCQIWTASNAQ